MQNEFPSPPCRHCQAARCHAFPTWNALRVVSLARPRRTAGYPRTSCNLEPTSLFTRWVAAIGEFQPAVRRAWNNRSRSCSAAETRSSAARFGSLSELLPGAFALQADCAVLLLAHPSVKESKILEQRTSGSTAWSNSVRSQPIS